MKAFAGYVIKNGCESDFILILKDNEKLEVKLKEKYGACTYEASEVDVEKADEILINFV